MKRYFVEYEGMLNREFVQQETGENTTFRKCFRYQAEKLAARFKIMNNIFLFCRRYDMLYVVSYDISGTGRGTKLAKALKEFAFEVGNKIIHKIETKISQ